MELEWRLFWSLCSRGQEWAVNSTVHYVVQGSRLSCGMRALTTTPVRTSGVTSVSLRCTRWDGAHQAANPLYLRKVRRVPNLFTILFLNVCDLWWWLLLIFLWSPLQPYSISTLTGKPFLWSVSLELKHCHLTLIPRWDPQMPHQFNYALFDGHCQYLRASSSCYFLFYLCLF